MKYYSFSQLQLYRRCPAKYKKAYIDKIKDLPNEAMKRGSRIHSEIADYISGNTVDCKFDKPYNFDRFVSNVEGATTEVEEKIVLDFFEFGLVGYVDYFSTKNNIINIVDWKSGHTDGDGEQLKIYAGALFEEYPLIDIAVGYFYYVDQKGRYDKYVFTREEIEEYMQDLEEELTGIHNAKEYPETPNDYCKWCSSYAGCMRSKKFAVERIETKQDFIRVLDLKKLAEATVDKTKRLIKEYMEHNCIDTFVNGAEKIYLTTTTTMRTGKLKKEELIDTILQINPGEDKKDLSKLKVAELVDMVQIKPETAQIEEKKEIDTNISSVEEKPRESQAKKSNDNIIVPVENVTSKTKKKILINTLKNYLEETGQSFEDFSSIPMNVLQRNDLYKIFKVIVSKNKEQTNEQ